MLCLLHAPQDGHKQATTGLQLGTMKTCVDRVSNANDILANPVRGIRMVDIQRHVRFQSIADQLDHPLLWLVVPLELLIGLSSTR